MCPNKIERHGFPHLHLFPTKGPSHGSGVHGYSTCTHFVWAAVNAVAHLLSTSAAPEYILLSLVLMEGYCVSREAAGIHPIAHVLACVPQLAPAKDGEHARSYICTGDIEPRRPERGTHLGLLTTLRIPTSTALDHTVVILTAHLASVGLGVDPCFDRTIFVNAGQSKLCEA